jgi:hypothetical protein
VKFFVDFWKFFGILWKKLEVDLNSFYQKSRLFISEVVKMYIQPLFRVELLSNEKRGIQYYYTYILYIHTYYFTKHPLRAFF